MVFNNNKTEKSVISVRLDAELLERIDAIAEKNDLSRNEVIAQGMKFSLDTEDANKKALEKSKNKKSKVAKDTKNTNDTDDTNESDEQTQNEEKA